MNMQKQLTLLYEESPFALSLVHMPLPAQGNPGGKVLGWSLNQ